MPELELSGRSLRYELLRQRFPRDHTDAVPMITLAREQPTDPTLPVVSADVETPLAASLNHARIH